MVGDNNIQLNAIGIEMFGPRAVSSVERSTVEPPNKGHFGNGHFVLSEAVPISEACHCLTIAYFQ